MTTVTTTVTTTEQATTMNISELSNAINISLKKRLMSDKVMLIADLRHSEFIVLKSVVNKNTSFGEDHRVEFSQVWFPSDALGVVIAARCPICKPKVGLETYWHYDINTDTTIRVCDMEDKAYYALLNSIIQKL